MKPFAIALAVGFALAARVHAEERFLLAADNQVVEINRAGQVTDVLKHRGHGGIYDAWRLPDGGIAYAHKGGLAVFDAAKRLVLDHRARAGSKGAEANSCAVLDDGVRFALMDSGVSQIRTVDRGGIVISETPLPDLEEDPLHTRYRTIRAVPGESAYWVAQYRRKMVLKVEMRSGAILSALPLEPLLKPSSVPQECFAMLQARDGSLFVTTSAGGQLLHVDAKGRAIRCWTMRELGLTCRYLLGMQELSNGHVLVACGDFHLKSADEGRDLLAEVNGDGQVVWRLTRDQLVDQIEGVVDSRSGVEEMRVTNVHAYDGARVRECLNVRR